MAIFREWFAARALVEGAITAEDIGITSDRWVVPLAIAINSENRSIGSEIMETISVRDPGLASLVLEEVKHSWSTEQPTDTRPPGSAVEIGHRIRLAMCNWREGLGPLMPSIGPTTPEGDIPSLLVDKGPRLVTTSWHAKEVLQLGPVIALTEDLNPQTVQAQRNWPIWRSTEIEPTRVWPWTTTKDELSGSLSIQMKAYRFALDSEVGLREYVAEFARNVSGFITSPRESPKVSDVIDLIEAWVKDLGRGPIDAISFNRTT